MAKNGVNNTSTSRIYPLIFPQLDMGQFPLCAFVVQTGKCDLSSKKFKKKKAMKQQEE